MLWEGVLGACHQAPANLFALVALETAIRSPDELHCAVLGTIIWHVYDASTPGGVDVPAQASAVRAREQGRRAPAYLGSYR